MEIKISVKSYEQLDNFRKIYYSKTGLWLKDYNAIINKMTKIIDSYSEGVDYGKI